MASPTTVPQSTDTAPAERPSRLQAMVALAVLCRDNGIDWPEEVRFSEKYPDYLYIGLTAVADLHRMTVVLALEIEPTQQSEEHVHHRALGNWMGYRTRLLCLVPKVAPIDEATSATIDDLAATVMTS